MKDEEGNVLITIDEVASVDIENVKQDTRETEFGVKLKFTDSGSKKFADITQQLVGKQLGIYVDDELISNPTIACAITGGEAVISNFESYDDAMKVVEAIRGSSQDVEK